MLKTVRDQMNLPVLVAVVTSLLAMGLFLFIPSDWLDIGVVYRGF